MFIIIQKNGEKTISHSITQEELNAVEAGVVEIIRVDTLMPITTYYTNEWHEIKLV